MKKTTLLLSCLFTLLSFAAFGQEFPPSWYSEDVTVSETTMTRKNKNGDWVEFVDKTFTACAEVKVQDDIYSLEMARDAAEELANKKLDSYLKSKKEKEALNAKHERTKYKYNDSLSDGGAYVQVQVLVSVEKVQNTEKNNSGDLKKELAASSNLSRVLMYGDARLTLVDNIKFSSQESLESHRLVYLRNSDENKVKGSIVALSYKDGTKVEDKKVELGDFECKFNLRNVIKGRKTVIFIRVDSSTDNNELVIEYNNKQYKSKIEHTNSHAWQNCIFEIDEGEIVEYSPTFVIKGSSKKVSVASIFIYQVL